MPLYSVKLLHRFRIGKPRKTRAKYVCVETVCTLKARSRLAAYRRALRLGKEDDGDYVNGAGQQVTYECLGVIYLMQQGHDLGTLGCGRQKIPEVWRDVQEMWLSPQSLQEILQDERGPCMHDSSEDLASDLIENFRYPDLLPGWEKREKGQA